MVTRSLFTGVSGLQSHLDKMGVISNNISNINTPGFKKSNMVFKSFLSQQISSASRPTETQGGTNPQSIGLGVQIGSVNLDMSQGQLQRTGVNTDLALQGDGFFTVRESGSQNNLYTRAGSFQFDANGRLVDPSTGNIVQGYNAEVQNGAIGELVAQGQPEDVQVTQGMQSIPGQATTFQNLSGNLDANAEVGIDPVNVQFENSAIRYEFERYHPTKNLYRFSAVWTQNPPSGKQVGDAVTDQVTGRNLEGIMQLNDQGQVTGIFRNPDTNGNNGIEQVEVQRNPGTAYTLDRSGISVRDQFNLFEDIKNQDWNGEMRLQFQDGAGNYEVQWQDIDGNWNAFTNDAGANVTGNIGSDFVLQRDANSPGSGTNDRVGELRIDSNFVQGSTSTPGDSIFFSVAKADETGILNQTGEEVKEEFRWGGSGSQVFRTSSPTAVAGNTSSTQLRRVFNYEEANLNAQIANTSSQNEIPNKEFTVDFDQGNAVDFTVSSPGTGSNIINQNGNQVMNINEDHQLFADANANNVADPGEELGISIAADDWSANSAAAGDSFEFQVTQARSTGSNGRAYSVVRDGDGNETALFAPSDDQPSNISFAPNLNDTSGILNNTSPGFTNLLATSGTGATAQQKDPATIQVTASSDVFDSLGNQHTLSYQFEKTDDNSWMWHATDPTPVDPNNPKIAGFGTVTFNESGQVQSTNTFAAKTAEDLPPPGPQGDLERNQVYFNPPPETLQSDPSASDSLNPDVGAEPVAISPDFSNITQFAGENNVEVTDQDGVSQGQLASLSFNSRGILKGSYTNGESRDLAQLSIAQFRNPAGLEKQGSTNFAESANSGIARPGTAGTGGRGTITPGALERSNVDLSAQFTTMISTQRGFQANTRTITTTDQMIQSVLALTQ